MFLDGLLSVVPKKIRMVASEEITLINSTPPQYPCNRDMNSYSTVGSSVFLERLLQQSSGNPNGNSNGDPTTTQPNAEVNPGDLLYGAVFLAIILSLFFITGCCWDRRASNNTVARAPRASSRERRTSAELPPKADFEKLLSKTTMNVSRKDLFKREDSQHITGDISKALDNDDMSSAMFDIELGDTTTTNSSRRSKMQASAKSSRSSFDFDEGSSRVLKLPSDKPNGDRLVHGTCAICLSSFKKGEAVSWSPSPKCSHAYHQTCIVQYANTATAKTHDHSIACPMCRETFVEESKPEANE